MQWAVVRSTGLTPAEMAAVEEHVQRWRRTINGYGLMVPRDGSAPASIAAWYSIRPTPMDPDEPYEGGYNQDVFDEIWEAVTELKQLLDGTHVHFADDFHVYAWDGEGFDIASGAAEKALPEIDWPRWNDDAWVHLVAAAETETEAEAETDDLVRLTVADVEAEPPVARLRAAVAGAEAAVRDARERPIRGIFDDPGDVSLRSEQLTAAIQGIARALGDPTLEDVRALLERELGRFFLLGDAVETMSAARVEQGIAAVALALTEAVAVRTGKRRGPGPANRLLAPGELLAGMVERAAPAASPNVADDSGAEDAAIDPALVERLRALVGHPSAWDERRSIETHDPLAVARAGLSILRDVPDAWDMHATVAWALGALVDRSPVRAAMIDLWSGSAPYQGFWQKMARVLEPAASDPILLAAVAGIVLAADGDVERRRAAIELLGEARTAWADALPVLAQRARLDRERTSEDARWRDSTIESLGRLRRAEAAPILLLELAADTGGYWSTRVRALVEALGDDALPWLRRLYPCARAADAVVDQLEKLPSALAWLHELAADPEPRMRVQAARALVRRGADELPWAASIWKTLDAAGFEADSYVRADTLERLGVDREQRKSPADWDALVRAAGATPRELPPLPDIIELLTLPDERRVIAIERLGNTPDPGALLALVLAHELYEALRRRADHPPLSGPRWREWAAAVPEWPFADAYGLLPDMLPWLRANRPLLPPQRLTPALQEILDDGADDVAARAPDPQFRLVPAEQITLDAAERALIATWEAARGTLPAAAPHAAPIASTTISADAGELFGVVLERPPPRVEPRGRAAPAAVVPGSAAGEVLAVAAGCATIRVDRDRHPYHYLAIDVTVENRLPRPVKLVGLEVALRDGDGAFVDHARRVTHTQFWHHTELSEELGFMEGSLDRARTVDLFVTHEVGFRSRVVVADLVPDAGGALAARASWPHRPADIAPGYPAFDAHLSVFRPAARHVRCEAVLELALRTPVREPVPVEILFLLRNRGGSIVERTSERAVLDPTGPIFVHADCLGLTQETLRTARRLEVAVAGVLQRTERLATFTLDP